MLALLWLPVLLRSAHLHVAQHLGLVLAACVTSRCLGKRLLRAASKHLPALSQANRPGLSRRHGIFEVEMVRDGKRCVFAH